MDPKASTRERQVYRILSFLVVLLGVGYLVFQVLKPFFAALAWAVVLAVVFAAPWQALARRMPRRRGLAAGLLTLAIALVVLLPAALFVGVLATQAVSAADQVVAGLRSRNISSFSDVVAMPEAAHFLDAMKTRLGIAPADFQELASGFLTRASTFVAAASGRLVLSFFDALLTFATTLFLLFFFFHDGEQLSAAALDLLPTDAAGRHEVRHSLGKMVGAIFRGSLFLALVQGVSGGIGWWLAGLGSPVLAGATMAVLSLLPIGGTAIIWLPGSLWAWTTGHHGAAIFLFVWGAVVTSFLADNVLRPLLIRGAEELSTLVVFLGVFGGLATFGLLGIFIGPMALATFASLLGALRRRAQASSEARIDAEPSS
ncbi:MAG TPA: AI-2E family transporter [Thermoanaerobaculia bacterium]|jgi:predicted PurR-regulated permease PerM|nr:AI-2E family transporter [Thermoanaerobaculia bacterium]